MKNIIIVIVIIIGVVAIASSIGSKKDNNQKDNVNQPETSSTQLAFPGKLSDDQIENKKAVIQTDKGIIEIALMSDKAPLTVSNFVYLVNKGFYDGLTFHRIEPDFVVQGGDPGGNGTGGPGYKFEDEKVQGEYVEGTVAMANSGPNTNGSQFFINLVDNSKKLTKSYNLFGQVTSGMDVVKKLAVGDKMNSVKIVDSK